MRELDGIAEGLTYLCYMKMQGHDSKYVAYKVLTILHHINQTTTPTAAVIFGILGSVFLEQTNYPEAINHYLKSLKIDEKTFGVNSHQATDTLNNLGSAYSKQGKYSEAINHYLKSVNRLS